MVKKTDQGIKKPGFFTCLGRYGVVVLATFILNYTLQYDFSDPDIQPIFSYKDILHWGFWIAWYLIMFFTKEKTTVHDMLFKTRVVMGKVN